MYQATIKGDKRFHSLSEGMEYLWNFLAIRKMGNTYEPGEYCFGFLCDHVSTRVILVSGN